MFTKTNSCPVCYSPWKEDSNRCVSCGSVAELYYERSFPVKGEVNEEKIERNVSRVRAYLLDHENHGLAHYTLGLSYVNLGLLPEGLVELRRAAQLLPEKVQIAYEAVVLATKQGDISDDVLNQINRVIQRKPDYKEALYLMGIILRKRAQITDAVQAWQNAYKIDRNYSPAAKGLRWFINENEKLLQNQKIARSIHKHPLPQNAIDYLNLISRDEPIKPPSLGKTSLKVLEAISPEKAKLMQRMYSEELYRYEELMQQRSSELNTLREDILVLSEICVLAHENRGLLSTSSTISSYSPTSKATKRLTIAERSQILNAEVQRYQKQGYSLVARTETTAQLSKKHEFSCCLAVFLALIIIGIILYLLYYLTAKKEDLVFLEVDEFGQIHRTYS